MGFLTDPQSSSKNYVRLVDDRSMIGSDNVVPALEAPLRTEYGDALLERLNVISANLTTESLRSLDAQAAGDTDLDAIAERWLSAHGLAGSGTPIAGTELRFASQAFAENRLLARIYAKGLANAGYRSANVMIDYAASMAEFLDGNRGFTSKSTDDTMRVVRGWLAKDNMLAAEPAPARNNNVFTATRGTAKRLGLKRISDLAKDGLKRVATRSRVTVAQALPGASALSNPVLRPGSSGPEVTDLQTRLRRLGYTDVQVDGVFGVATERAVKAFRKAHSLTVDGIVGQQTRTAIRNATAAEIPRAQMSGVSQKRSGTIAWRSRGGRS